MTKLELLNSAAHAEKVDSTGRKITRTYGAGRVCEAEGCRTILSVYNRGPKCSACTPLKRVGLRAF